MVGLFSWLSKREDEDWEKVLSDLDGQIRKAEISLSDIGVRNRRVLFTWLYYSIPIYVLYVLAYFTYFTPSGDPWQLWLIKTTPLVIGPPFIYTVRRFIANYYVAKRRNRLSDLENLRIKQKEKVEELKKKTAYYTTKGLLERYDSLSKGGPNQGGNKGPQDPKTAGPPVVRQPGSGPAPGPTGQPVGPPGLPATANRSNPEASGPFAPGAEALNGGELPQGVPPIHISGPGSNMHTQPAVHEGRNRVVANAARRPRSLSEYLAESTSGKKGLFDKLVDFMIGETDGPHHKYALICEECFTHNGLVPPEKYTQARFRCMRCNHLNVPKNYDDIGQGQMYDMAGPRGRTPSPSPSRQGRNSAPDVMHTRESVSRDRSASGLRDTHSGGEEENKDLEITPVMSPDQMPVDAAEGEGDVAPYTLEPIVPLMDAGANESESEGLRPRRPVGGAGASDGE
ncbi:hypothetical protein HK104_011139 [Borealophlyctis nickersoniae]|nr:hypothetical protein HK104_011139 [Borealophlyctis nickersoniae]